jgi:2-succinyl-5-enolpyruvyl-6-hydroxy-3-cyclohexene-1-carboxylate synthase
MLPAGTALFLGNSMPVRDMDMFGFWESGRNLHVFANRGASGIDGVIATAAGVARGQGTAVTLVVGDLSALHDLNSLSLLCADDQPPVHVVVINNNGGGIFHFLPIARQSTHFEEFFGTPHGFDFQHAANQFRLDYERPNTIDQFERAYAAATRSQKSCLIELTTDREQNVRLHRDIGRAITSGEPG